jgi:outer membrane lipoprotein-sorting protein
MTARAATAQKTRRTAIGLGSVASAMLVLIVAPIAAAAVRDPVPLPRPRPANAPVAVAEDAGPARKSGPARAIKVPISANSRFSPTDQEALFHINNYFNSFRTMEGKFIQFGPHGEQSEGTFYISRPGKIRFHYKPPVKLDVIADGKNVAVRDNRTMTQDYYPLGKTPLRYLLASNTNLTSDKLINEVRQEPDLIALVIVENSTFVKGKLTLIFDRESFALKQWIVTDAQGLNTSVAIYDVAVGRAANPANFKINYQSFGP